MEAAVQMGQSDAIRRFILYNASGDSCGLVRICGGMEFARECAKALSEEFNVIGQQGLP